ncbi:MAG: glycosyltransferase family 4 protein [Candidatus Methanomethylicia archaeon]
MGVIIPNNVWSVLEEILSVVKNDLKRRITIHRLLGTKRVEYETSNKYLEDVEAFNVDFVYSLHEVIDAVVMASYIASKISKPFGILLQSNPYYEDLKTVFHLLSMEGWSIPRLSIKHLLASYTNTYIKKIYLNDIVRNPKLRFIVSVSEAPFMYSGLRKYCRCTRSLHPANAYDSELIKYRNTSNKDDYAVFSARLTCEKGILEIPYIWRKVVSKLPDAKLIITGIFSKQKVKTEFEKLLIKLNLSRNVEYLGYVSWNDNAKIMSKAKVLVYPSHIDAFPLIVLESLALGTTVVAYDIPAIRSIYKDVKAVLTVPEYDVNAMAYKVINILKMDSNRLAKLHEDELTLRFLSTYGSWDEVVKAEIRMISEAIRTS